MPEMPELEDRNTAVRAGVGADGNGLRVALESRLPASVPAGQAIAVFCFGHCFHVSQPVAGLVLLVDGTPHRPAASRMPRRDLFEWLHRVEEDGSIADPAGHSYRSGFWLTVPLPTRAAPGTITVEAAVTLGDGRRDVVPLASMEVVPRAADTPTTTGRNAGLIAVAMATYEPDPKLFRIQIESLRAQTDEAWRCVISDDGTGDERFGSMEAVLAGDSRFTISRTSERLGPYRNFERALTLASARAELLALCDQDDRWYPEKLAVLRAALGNAQLVYSDQRLVTSDGRLLRASLWEGRRRDDENLASLLVANSVPGAATLFRRELAERAIPFPDAPGVPYHDHWLALVALASGEIAYVEKPLYDYVQHSAAVMAGAFDRASARSRRRGSRGWRGAYFAGYIGRQIFAQTLLLRCATTLTKRKRRALEWFSASERSPLHFAWLALRPLRRLIGRDETLGGEAAIVKGLLWPYLLRVAAGGAQVPGHRAWDASFPDPPEFEQPRLRRWRGGT
jgi:glycosyltransferase involved in cell wall biosynthesis